MTVIVGKTNTFETKSKRERAIIDFVMTTVRDSEVETGPSRELWKQNEELFAGKQEWGPDYEREDWRSRLFVHEYAPIIREAAVAAQNQIFSRGDFINLVAGDAQNRELAEIQEKLIRYYLDEIGFAQKFYEWALCGGIYGMATWKLYVQNKLTIRPEILLEKIEKDNRKATSSVSAANKPSFFLPDSLDEIETGLTDAMNRLFGKEGGYKRSVGPKKNLELGICLEVVNPTDYFWMPDCKDINDSPWHAEKYYQKFSELRPLFDAGILDKSKRDRLLKHSSNQPYHTFSTFDTYQTQKQRQRDQFSANSNYWPTIEVIEYFGPFLDTNGDVLEENCHFIVANGKFVLRDKQNGYWDQKPPYQTAIFNRRPGKPNGSGIGDGAANSQLILNELMSLFLDALKIDVYSPLAVNRDMLVDPSQIDTGIQPGSIIHTYNGSAKDAFSELPKASDIAPQVFQMSEYLKLAGQKSASVNTMTSNPSSRARISSAEIKSNDGRRVESLNTLGFEIDVNGIEPLVNRLKLLIIQFGFTDTNLGLLASRGILAQSEYELVAGMPSTDRFEEAMKSFKVEVKGFRAAIERDQYLSRVGEYMQQINMMPPFVHEMLDWRTVLKDLTDAYGFKGDKWLRQRDERDRAREENVFLSGDQLVATTPQDDDAQHLGIHFEELMKTGPVQALVQHVQMQIHQGMAKGAQLPPPPPEVANMLGLPAPASPDAKQQQRVTQRLTENNPKTPLLQ